MIIKILINIILVCYIGTHITQSIYSSTFDQLNDQIYQELERFKQSELNSNLFEKQSDERARDGQEIFIVEDREYPRFLFENYTGVGRVSGITALPSDDIAIFHRANRNWDANTFDKNHKFRLFKNETQHKSSVDIKTDTIMILNREDGTGVASFGSDIISMPHGIASDPNGNLWVSDVARHQVMRLPVGDMIRQADWTKLSLLQFGPDIVLGESYVPGSDLEHFCQPSEIKVSSNGRFIYIADGYCNKRIMVFNSTGGFVASLGEGHFDSKSLVHSIALVEKRNLVCVSDRTNARILCFNAGLDGNIKSMGKLVVKYDYPLGEVFAIASVGPNNLVVSSRRYGSGRFDLSKFNLITEHIDPIWVSGDLLEPHSLTRTNDGSYIYVADLAPKIFKKVYAFKVVKGMNI